MIYFLTGYIAFEEFILKFLPVSDTVYSYLRFLSEILIYVAFGKLVIHKLHRGIPFVKTAIDLPIIGFYSGRLVVNTHKRIPLDGPVFTTFDPLRVILYFFIW